MKDKPQHFVEKLVSLFVMPVSSDFDVSEYVGHRLILEIWFKNLVYYTDSLNSVTALEEQFLSTRPGNNNICM